MSDLYGTGSGTEQNIADVAVTTWTKTVVFDRAYLIDEGHDVVMIGVELDPLNGGLVHLTRAAYNELADAILKERAK